MGILTFLSMFLNTYISIEERTTIIEDNPYKMIIYFIIVLVVLFFVRRFYKLQKRSIIEKCLYEFVLYS